MTTTVLKTVRNITFKKTMISITAGFSVFAMFFGSGNLVFPLELGKIAGANYPIATIGLLLSGILIPSLGLFGIIKVRGSIEKFFSKLGPRLSFLLPLLMLSLLGPFGVIPRCLTVAHASFSVAFGDFPIWIFALLFCAACYFIILNRISFVDLIGGILTPLLLLSLAAIIFAATNNDSAPVLPSSNLSISNSFMTGISEGYQTMDLLAAFFFAVTIMGYLNQKLNHPSEPDKCNPKTTLVSIFIGGSLLAVIYGFMVYLGFHYTPILEGIAPENYISTIALHTLGNYAGIVVSLAVILACLTTAIALTKISTSFMHEKLVYGKLSFHTCLLIVLSITVLFSFFKFHGIIAFLAPILEILYPSLIVICLGNLFLSDLKPIYLKLLFYGTATVSTIHYIYS